MRRIDESITIPLYICFIIMTVWGVGMTYILLGGF